MKRLIVLILVIAGLGMVTACSRNPPKDEPNLALEQQRAQEAEQQRQAELAQQREAREAQEREREARRLAKEKQDLADRQRELEAEKRREIEALRQAAAEREALEQKAAQEARQLAEQKAAQEARQLTEQKAAQEARRLAERNAELKEQAEAARQQAEQEAAAAAARVAAEQQALERQQQQADRELEAQEQSPEAVDNGVSAAEIASLDGELTPVGAIRGGNAEGTIPAWQGGITAAPAGYTVGDHHPDPFPGDEPIFIVDQSNVAEHVDQLSPGQISMIEKYASYNLPVYRSRRTASFPERTYEMTRRNAGRSRLTADGEGVVDAAEGFPFPIPKNAKQLIWNHKLKFKGTSGVRYNNQVAPTSSGAYTLIKLREELLAPYFERGRTTENIDNILLYFYQLVEGPARLAGNVLLVHETLNQVRQPRQAWIYNPGQRRVRRAPNVAYDNPGTASDGLRTNDMTDMFNGALDRYDWELVGKREMIVPYNAYRAHSSEVEYDDLVGAGHLNPDLMRYELHRVWVVDANLKGGMRHINARRTYYLDEDSYQILLVDHYDKRGALWRFSEAHSINYYDLPTFWSTLESHHDLQSGRYLAVGLDNQGPVNDFRFENSAASFTPAALRKRGKR